MNRTLLAGVFLLSISDCALAQTPWQKPLYLGNDGYWQQRIRVEVANAGDATVAGDPVAIRIGKALGDAALAGQAAKAIRVCDSKGQEMLWSLTGPTGEPIPAGPIPAGSTLAIPVECEAHGKAVYWVYFDNPQAWEVPDMLEATGQLRNGGMEDGTGDAPSGWQHDAPDEQHQASWTTENPHSGKKCLKTVVAAGADPTWIATRQSGIRITGGAKYVLRAWVKAQGVVGDAGWYIHLGNEKNSMLTSPMLSGGAGTYDWKEVKTEFTAPPDATRAELGTVLRGTGVAWFDDVSMETTDKPSLSAIASAPEALRLTEVGADSKWAVNAAGRGKPWSWRVPLRVMNLSDQPIDAGMDGVELSGLTGRLLSKADFNALQVVDGARVVHHARLGDMLLFDGAAVQPRTIKTYYLYLPPGAGRVQAGSGIPEHRTTGTTEDTRQANAPSALSANISLSDYRALLQSPRNLLKNPDFETGDTQPDGWAGGAEGDTPAGVTLGFDKPGLFGARCVRIAVPKDAKTSWTGWRQEVPVKPGRTYLYAAWIKCADLAGSAQIHAHILDAAGKAIRLTGAGPAISGTTGWTLLSAMFEMPPDAASFQAHLTMNVTGTVWHDGAVFVEMSPAAAGKLEGRIGAGTNGLSAWPVNAIVKVFQEDTPPTASSIAGRTPPVRITAARSEKEPLQLAVRSGTAIPGIQVVIDPPTNAAGARLSDVRVGVVGYVPIDHTTNYYNVTTPAYYRKYPTTPGASDGWAGMWPDPLLPRDRFDLKADTTQPVWLTVSVPKDAAPGDYTGRARFVAGGKTLTETPFIVHVWDFELPDELHTAAIYDAGLGDRWQVAGQTAEQTRRQFWKFLADHRVCPDRVYPEPVLRYENGKVISDFTQYDEAAAYYFDVLHLPHSYTPSVFYMFGWGFPPSEKFGEKPYSGDYPYDNVDRGKLRPEFKTAVQACLKVYWEHMKAKGWANKVVFYMSDEPFYSQAATIAQMKALCQMVKEVDPAIPMYSSTWGHVPEWDGYLNLWGIGHFGDVPAAKIKEIRDSGVRIRYTTDGQMCTDTPYLAIERLLPHYCFKYNVEAYEFWGCAWLTYDPYRYGWHSYIYQSDAPGKSYYVRYPNGDGYIAYPGAPIGNPGPVPSIRMEQAREGVEDYEYLYLLKDLVAKAKAAGKDTSVGEKTLQAADGLVDMPSAGGRYSTKILPDPDQVFRVKEEVARAIERLKG